MNEKPDGFTLRQGTVYEENATGRRLVLINHNPMELRSLALHAESAAAPFDPLHPDVITVDEIIDMRQSGGWNELGDLPAETFAALLKTLLAQNVLEEPDAEAVRMLQRSLPA